MGVAPRAVRSAASSDSEQAYRRRSTAVGMTSIFAERRIGVNCDTIGPDDTFLRLRGASCNSGALRALPLSDRDLVDRGFASAICVNDRGATVAERSLAETDPADASHGNWQRHWSGAERSPSETDPPDAGRPAASSQAMGPDSPFHAYVSSRFPGARAWVGGVQMFIRAPRCVPSMLTQVGRMDDAPDILEQVLRSDVQFFGCVGEDHHFLEVRRWPIAGVRIPESIDWERRYVVTPRGLRIPAAAVWCFHDGRGGLPGALCFRREAECLDRRDETMETFRGIDLIGEGLAQAFQPCRVTSTLWCFQTLGTEQQCTVSREACHEWRRALGEEGARCEARNAL